MSFNTLYAEPVKCRFCSRPSKSQNSLKQHEARCIKNPNRKTNPRFEHYSNTLQNVFVRCKYCHCQFNNSTVLGGHTPFCQLNPNRENNRLKMGCWLGKKHSIISKKKISEKAQEGIKNGTWHTGNSWLGVIEYQSKNNGKVFVMGNWELEYVKYLDSHDIKWIWNHRRFRYESSRQPSGYGWYKPDFYLVDEGCYVEVKGYETQLDADKWKCFPHKLKILRGKDLIQLGIDIKL